MRAQVKPVRYMYLDTSGVEGLYAQTVDRIEVEYSTTVEKALSGKVGAIARLKNLLMTFLAVPEIEISGELSGSRKNAAQSTLQQPIEQKLARLIETLRGIGEPAIFSKLATAARHADSTNTTTFINIEDEFDAPQFFSSDGINLVNRDGYLILEKGGTFGYEPGDHYYKKEQISRLVTMSASILKMRESSRGMALTGHDAVLFRGYNGRRVPLSVFGELTATPAFFQIKPYAIWRP